MIKRTCQCLLVNSSTLARICLPSESQDNTQQSVALNQAFKTPIWAIKTPELQNLPKTWVQPKPVEVSSPEL